MARILCALAPAAVLFCPPAHGQSGNVIWEGDDQAVVLVSQDEKTAPPNEHPVTISAREVERMLASLRFRYADQDGDAPPVPVFTAGQVEILGAALAAGLGRATPSQDIRFSIIGAHRLSPDAFVRRNRLTAGRAFFREGRLNLIFGELHSPYRKKNVYGRLEQDFSPRQYGSRARPGEREAILLASTETGLHESGDGPRPDWVVFAPDLAATGKPSFAEEPPRRDDGAAAVPERSGRETAPNDPPAAEPSAAAGAEIEERLRALKHLRDEGLISEQAYRQKVEEILEEL